VQSRGSDAPFIPVNWGGIARDLIASELFGYSRGSFTGASDSGRTGRIAAADGGTLCLDEIGEMPMELQPYLLRVLEDGVVYPVGSQDGRDVELSLVSMTNRSLAAEISAGRFRSDLFYRIAAATITVPPLRERGDDIILLAERFARQARSASFERDAPLRRRGIAAHSRLSLARRCSSAAQRRRRGRRVGAGRRHPLRRSPAGVSDAGGKRRADNGALRKAEEIAIREAVEACGGNMTDAPTPTWQVIREFYCPVCGTAHGVEAPTPWYPIIRDFEPDIDTFYKEWLGLPIPERVEAASR
jgi:DNA-binding NtrC family response regulator